MLYEHPTIKDFVGEARFFSVPFGKAYDVKSGYVEVKPCDRSQADLADMHFAAMDKHYSMHKSCLPFFKRKTYEADLEARTRRLPDKIRGELRGLVKDREAATKTPWRSRLWTVVAMHEQLRRSFTSAQSEIVTEHRFRKWKNRRTEFVCILQGCETNVSTAEAGFTTFRRHTNPWKSFYQDEKNARDFETQVKQEERSIPPRPRSVPPAPAPKVGANRIPARERQASPPTPAPSMPPFPSAPPPMLDPAWHMPMPAPFSIPPPRGYFPPPPPILPYNCLLPPFSQDIGRFPPFHPENRPYLASEHRPFVPHLPPPSFGLSHNPANYMRPSADTVPSLRFNTLRSTPGAARGGPAGMAVPPPPSLRPRGNYPH